MEQCLTVTDLRDGWKVTSASLYKQIREGKIPYFRIGKNVRFLPSEIHKWMEERRNIPYHRDK